MERSIFDTVAGVPISAKEEPSLFDLPGTGFNDYFSGNPQPVGKFGVGESVHDWGIKPSEVYKLGEIRAAHQGGLEQFGAFLNQAVVGEILGGTMEGTGYLLDLESYGKLLTGTEKEFGNWFSDIGKKLRTWSEEATPIYTDPSQDKFAPGHWSWWMKNGKSVASTLSLMIPAAGAIRGAGMVGKALGFANKLSPMAKWMTTGLAQAGVSRHMEGMMEASGVQKELYQKGLDKGMTPTEAEEYAARGASKTYNLDWAMYLQDVPQYLLLNKAFGKASTKLADRSIKASMAMGHKLAPVIGSKAAAIGWDMLGEGFEEGYQFIAAEEAKYLANKFEDPSIESSFDTRLNKYVKDGEFWTSAVMGALGAGVMQTAGKAINDLIQGGDPQVRFLKEFGSRIAHAAQQVHFADLIGSESGKRTGIMNLEDAVFSKAVQLPNGMANAKDIIKRSANLSEEDIQNFGLTEQQVSVLKDNSEEILKHAEEFERRYEDNSKKFSSDPLKALKVTSEEFTIDTFNGYKQDYTNRLSAVKDKIPNFNELSFEAQDIFAVSSEVLKHQKFVDLQKKRLAATGESRLSKKQKEQVEKSIQGTEKTIARLKGDIETLDKSRDPEVIAEDDAKDIGGPYNLLNVKDDKEITSHAILEYKKLDEALVFADATLKASQQRLKEILSGKKETVEPQPIDKDTLTRIPENDDYVLYTIDGKEQTGIVDYLDEDGDYHIIPTTKWSEDSKYATKPSGIAVVVSKDKVVLDKKQYAEEDIHEEALGSDDATIDLTSEDDVSEKSFGVSYMHDEGGAIPVVDNEDLNRFLSNPNSSFEGVTAEMYVDTTSDFAIKYFKDKGFTDIEIRKIINGKLTDNDINELQARLGGFDTIPVGIQLIKDGKVLHKGGMYYHNTDFQSTKAPLYITQQGEERTRLYLANQKQQIRKNRFKIVPELLKGNEVYSDTLRRGIGHYNNTTSRGNILERHGLVIGDARLAVSRKNGRVYTAMYNILPGISAGTAGGIFAPTKKTINGKEAWAKVDPIKLTKEHAEILWDAIVTRYSKGKGGLTAFPDDRVTGLNVTEVITMLTLFSQRKTDPKHENNKDMAKHLYNKAFFVNSGHDLTFGSTTVNIHEDNMAVAESNKDAFIKWAMANKNYSIPIGIKPMGIELNSPLKRTFKIGSWENKADGSGNFLTLAQFLMSVPVDGKNTFAVVSDLQEYENTGSTFTRPSLQLGDNANALKIRPRTENKPKVPKATTKSKARTKTVTKVKANPTIDSPLDLVNLPAGSEIYYMSNIVKEGVITEETEKVLLATVIHDKKLGRVLDLSRIQSDRVSKEFGQWLMLEHEDSAKSVDKFISYLKSRPHISKILVDVSGTVEEKVQVEPVVITEVKIKTKPESNETVEDILDIYGVPLEATFAEEVKSIVNLPKELSWFHKRFGVQNVKESDKLLTIASNGRKAFSVFTSDTIYIFTGAPEGALYHEAFHRVFLGYLSEEDRQRIYASARKQFGDLSDNELSERMAEDFRAYRLNNTKPKSRTIWQFFKDLSSFIVSYFTGQNKLTSNEIDRLYDSINRGHYRYSEISEDNRKRLENIQVPMAIEIRKTPIATIDNYHDLDNVVKFLTAILIQTNEIDNLNDIRHIKMSKMFEYVEKMMDRIETAVTNTQKQLDDGLITADKLERTNSLMQMHRNALGVFGTVMSKEYRPLFAEKISDMLKKLNVNRVQDEDAILDDISNNNYKEYYDRASYTINSKDNILASVKFLIATLPKNGKLDPHIGISEFVDFNDMWSSLMHNLYDINGVDEMMDRLKSYSDQYPYQVLVKKLEEDLTGNKKQQLRAAVQKHRHNFVNFLLTIGKEGVQKIEVLNADVSRASKQIEKTWNMFFYGSKVFKTTAEGVTINKDVVESIYNDYTTLSKKVDKEYSSTKVLADKNSIISSLVALLNRIGVKTDDLAVREMIKNRPAENEDVALFQTVVGDFSFVFNKVHNLAAKDKNIGKIFSDEKYVKLLAEAYVSTHPELISDIILGPSNNVYYVYSQNSYVSDTVRKIRTDRDFLEKHLDKTYNDNSYFGQQLLANDDTRKGLEVLTFAMFGDKGSAGSDYLDINPIEDYIFKITAMNNGLITFPTMADRKMYYLLKGVKPFDFKYNVTPDGTFMPAEAVDILLGYAKSERNRIAKAELVIEAYEEVRKTGDAEKIANIEKTLVEGYHYTIAKDGKKLTGKVNLKESNSAALLYHNFPSFNREGFNFDAEAREEIRQSIIDNIREELEYAESLGIISSTVEVSTGKKRYRNRLLDQSLVDIGAEDFGTVDMAIKNIIASFFVNTVIANNESEKLFSGDPAFFKTDKVTKRVIEDKVKRLVALTSTGDNFANDFAEQDLTDTTFNIVTVATQKYQAIDYASMQKWHTDIQKRRLKAENPGLTDEEIESKAKVIVADKLKAYRDMDPTDGQAWISPAMYKSLSQRLGEWSDEKNVAFDLLQLDRPLTLEEEKLTLNVTFQPLKLVYYDLLHDGDLAIPTYHKASFATIFRTITKGEYGDRQIADMLDRMEGKGRYTSDRLEKVDMFIMDSATKVGNRSKFNVLDEKLELFNDLSNVAVYKQPFSGLRRQLVTDTHDVERTGTGTQFLKIVLGNLYLNENVYTVDGKDVNGTYIKDIAFSALNSLSNRGRRAIEDKLGYKNGRIDKKKLVELLTEDAKKSNASDNLIDAIMMIGDNDMYLEIDALTDHKWIQSRIISLISKYTVDVKLPGNQLIQFANFGIRSINKQYTFEEELASQDRHISWVKGATDDLKWMKLENGKVVPMGAIVSINLFKHVIPNYDEISYEEKVKYLSDNPEILGYRIPTQGQNSVFMIRIVGIYPETIGDTITLPSEFTALTGSDFDIDKAYVVRYNYVPRTVKGAKTLEKIKFLDGDTNNETFLKKIYAQQYSGVVHKWEYVRKNTDSNTVNFTDDIRTNLNLLKDIANDIELEELFIKLLRLNKWDGAIYNRINEIVRHLREEDFIASNKGKNIYDVNSRKAVENRLLDGFFAVMRSEAHFEATSAPLGPLKEKLKNKAQDIRAINEKERVNMYYQSPRFNEEVKTTYNGGKDGIGPFALNNVHHVLAQLAGLEMKGTFGDAMYIKNGNIDLAQSRGKDGIFILDWFSALIDAHVDVAKDPYIMDLNVNSVTYNVVALLLRGGAGETTFDFIAQPILRELAKELLLTNERDNVLTKQLTIETGLDEEGQPSTKNVTAIEYIIYKWSKDLNNKEINEVNELALTRVFNDKLSKDLFTTDMTDKEFLKRQLLVLKAFTNEKVFTNKKIFDDSKFYAIRTFFNKKHNTLTQMGTKLNTLVQASQIDTKKFGSNITELRVFMNKIRKAYDDDAFVNIEKILPFNPDSGEVINVEGANFLGTYAANAIEFSLDVLGDISIYGTPVFEELFNKIVKVTGNEFTIDSKFVNLVSDEIFAAVVAKFFTSTEFAGIDSAKLKTLIEVTAQKLAFIKNNEGGIYDDLQDNAFIKYLTLIPSEDEVLNKIFDNHDFMFISVPMKSTKDKTDKDNMINSFKELLKHDRLEVRNLGRQLFYYSFFASGFRSRIYSYFALLPNEMFKEISVKDPSNPTSMVDRSYNQMIKNILEEMKNIMNTLSYNDIVEEVLINNHDNDNLIKLIKDRGIARSISEYKGKSYPKSIAVVLNQDMNKYLQLGWNEDKPVYRPYVKVRDSLLGHIILRYIGTIENQAVYVTQNMRSYNKRGFVVKEFNMDKSIVPAYNELNVITPAMEEEFMIHLADGKPYKYVPKAEQLLLTDQPDVVQADNGQVVEPYTWARYSANNYEVSTQGDKRFSALIAKLSDGRTIEDHYQVDVKGYPSISAGKGKKPLRNITREQSWIEYKDLWKRYFNENPELLKELSEVARGKVLTDKFANSSTSQARALAEILNENYVEPININENVQEKRQGREEEVSTPTQLNLFEEVNQTPSSIYDKLGNKTVSGNVRIESWNSLKDMTSPYTEIYGSIVHIIATRIKNSNEHFGNPFSHDADIVTKNSELTKTSTIREAVEKYIDWVINSQDERAKWIRSQIQSGNLNDKSILYYKELGEPSHATALDYLINKYDWTQDQYPFLSDSEQTDVQFSTEKQGVRDIVDELGVIDWTKVTKAEWARLREEYNKKCNI